MKQLALAIATLAFCHQATAQSFNIDLDISGGGPTAGQGVPSSLFGGAANQPGHWTRLGAASHSSFIPLRNLNGVLTNVDVYWNISGGGGGSGWTGNDGDHRLLMNDGTVITVPTTFQFSNLQPGRYKVFTYLADRSGEDILGDVTIAGADIETKVSGIGGMPGNEFIEGRTHAVHDVTLTTSALAIRVRTYPLNGVYTSLLGFQIVSMPVPEPSGFVISAVGLTTLLSFVRKTMPSQAKSNGGNNEDDNDACHDGNHSDPHCERGGSNRHHSV